MKTYSYEEQQELRNNIAESRIMDAQELSRQEAYEIISINAILDCTNESNDYDIEVNKMIEKLELETKIDFKRDIWIFPNAPLDKDLITATNEYIDKAMECLDNNQIFQVGDRYDLINYFIENCLTDEQREFIDLYDDAVNYDKLIDLAYLNEEITFEKVGNTYYIINF